MKGLVKTGTRITVCWAAGVGVGLALCPLEAALVASGEVPPQETITECGEAAVLGLQPPRGSQHAQPRQQAAQRGQLQSVARSSYTLSPNFDEYLIIHLGFENVHCRRNRESSGMGFLMYGI